MNKFYISFSIFFLSAFLANAQDSIILKSADFIVGKVISINDKEIEYKNFENINGPNYILNLTKVAGIKYQNGYLEVYDEKNLALNFRDRYTKQIPDNIDNNSNQDSLMNLLLINNQLLVTKYDQLIQTNVAIIDNQLLLDSLIQKNYELQELRFQEITFEQQSSALKSQQIIDSLNNLKNNLQSDKSNKEKENVVPKTIGIGFSFYQEPGLVIPITFGKNFRAEVEFALVGDNFSFFNLGLYGMYQKGKTNIYTGISSSMQFKYDFYIGPQFGAEYMFDPHFSFGGDVAIYFVELDPVAFNSSTRILFRFYF